MPRFDLYLKKNTMKAITLFTMLAILAGSSFAQDVELPPPPVAAPVNVGGAPSMEDPIYEMVEEQPVFKGGQTGMLDFIRINMKYPIDAKESNIEGKVFVSFIVEKDGTVSNVQVLRGVPGGPMLDKEALRIVKLFKFEAPGKMKGQPVRCKQIVPMTFKLT
jgi:protein TonB